MTTTSGSQTAVSGEIVFMARAQAMLLAFASAGGIVVCLIVAAGVTDFGFFGEIGRPGWLTPLMLVGAAGFAAGIYRYVVHEPWSMVFLPDGRWGFQTLSGWTYTRPQEVASLKQMRRIVSFKGKHRPEFMLQVNLKGGSHVALPWSQQSASALARALQSVNIEALIDEELLKP